MSQSEIVIALDAMGGDGAPDVVIRGANIARVRYPRLRFMFFGKETAIAASLERFKRLKSVSTIHHADEVIADDDAGRDRLQELSRQRVVDVAVETVGGRGDTLLTAQLAVRPKGRLLLLGVFTVPTVGINPLLLAAREVEIVGSMTYAASNGRADYQIAMEIVADHAAAARSLITQRFPLAAVHRAFGVALDKSSRSIKVHINPNG
jgi:glycerol-3-phosphate acyltransferase PlsX